MQNVIMGVVEDGVWLTSAVVGGGGKVVGREEYGARGGGKMHMGLCPDLEALMRQNHNLLRCGQRQQLDPAGKQSV